MRLDDVCLVNADVTVSDDFYSGLGLQRRMRNERFVDFLLGDGPRLALWMRPSIAETVGESYPDRPGSPFRLTVGLASRHQTGTWGDSSDAAAEAVQDPDGFVVAFRPSGEPSAPIVSVELAVADLASSRSFLAALGFGVIEEDDRSVVFDGGAVALTLVRLDAVDPGDPTWSRSGGHLMLAIELDTGEAVDDAYDALRARGLRDSGAPAVYEWGSRSVYFVDPDAFIWEIYAWVEEPR